MARAKPRGFSLMHHSTREINASRKRSLTDLGINL